MQVFVIRHTTPLIEKGLCYGQTNVPLAHTFIAEAKLIKEKLPNNIDAVYCSPLQRCQVLAKQLMCDDVRIDDRLIEYNFGDWENRLWSDIEPAEYELWMQNFVQVPSPNGDCVQDLFNRVVSFLAHLRSQNFQQVLLITHSGVIRAIWVYLLQLPLQNMFKIPVGFGELLVFSLGGDSSLDTIIQKG